MHMSHFPSAAACDRTGYHTTGHLPCGCSAIRLPSLATVISPVLPCLITLLAHAPYDMSNEKNRPIPRVAYAGLAQLRLRVIP